MSLSRCHCINGLLCLPYLPDPDGEELQDKAAEVWEANKVLIELRRKRPSLHHHYDHAKIGNFVALSGNKAAVDEFIHFHVKPDHYI